MNKQNCTLCHKSEDEVAELLVWARGPVSRKTLHPGNGRWADAPKRCARLAGLVREPTHNANATNKT